MGDATEPFDEDDDEALDTQGCFDFPVLVSDLYANWRVLVVALRPVGDLAGAISRLSEILPEFVGDTADERLNARLFELDAAMTSMIEGLKVAQHANQEMADDFHQLACGFEAARQIHEAADRVGFGYA